MMMPTAVPPGDESVQERERPGAQEAQDPNPIRSAAKLTLSAVGLLLLHAAATLMLTAVVFAWVGPAGAALGCPLSFLTGVACLGGSLKVLRGTERSSVVHGIACLLCGLLNVAFGVLVIVALVDHHQDWFQKGMFYATDSSRPFALLVGGVNLVAGLGLMGGGILSLEGRTAYRSWREARLTKAR